MKARNSRVFGAPILRTLNSEGCLPYDMLAVVDCVVEERWRETRSVRCEAVVVFVVWLGDDDERNEILLLGVRGASVVGDCVVLQKR
jgi:hypothetical protein